MPKRDETVLDARSTSGLPDDDAPLYDESGFRDRTIMDPLPDLEPDPRGQTERSEIPNLDARSRDETRLDPRLSEPPDFSDTTIEAPVEELEVEPVPVEEAMRASVGPDPHVSYEDDTDLYRATSGEGEDEFASDTVPVGEDDEAEVARLTAAVDTVEEVPEDANAPVPSTDFDSIPPTLLRKGPAPDAFPESYDPRKHRASHDPGANTSREPQHRPSVSATDAAVAVPKPSLPVRPSSIPAGPRSIPPRPSSMPPVVPARGDRSSRSPRSSVPPKSRLEVLDRKSVPPPSRERSGATGDIEPSEGSRSQDLKPKGKLISLPASDEQLWLYEAPEKAKRAAKVMPVALAGGLTIALVWVGFGGGVFGEMSDEAKEAAAEAYAEHAAAKSRDRAQAADPLIRIVSEPPGARVEVNNVELGRTPLLAPSPRSKGSYFLVVLGENGLRDWEAYLGREKNNEFKIVVLRQNYKASDDVLSRDAAGHPRVHVTLTGPPKEP